MKLIFPDQLFSYEDGFTVSLSVAFNCLFALKSTEDTVMRNSRTTVQSGVQYDTDKRNLFGT